MASTRYNNDVDGNPTKKKGLPENLTSELTDVCRELRRDVIEMTYRANSGHPGGSLSEIEILVALYFCVMSHDPTNPKWKNRDRFILSKGHASPGLYAVLSKCGYFPHSELFTYRQFESRIQGHAHPMTPGVEMNSGSLGQGISFGVGSALSSRITGIPFSVYVLVGDGECDEGQIWEAAMSASHYKLGNLTVVIDRNRIQNDRFTSEAMEIEPLDEKWKAFGWNVITVDGHDIQSIVKAVEEISGSPNQPTAIIANTVKGKGVSFMENNPDFHGRAPNDVEYKNALRELD